MPAAAPRLKYLSPAWYAIVMGLSGLAVQLILEIFADFIDARN